ncbi:MAG: hypothetical protein HN566_12335 [Polaribacter sp.]|nr:hypothetical protein [Polaribacter sp.]
MGNDAAFYMAATYAAGEGEYLGCVDGLAQGIHNGYQKTKNPSAELLTRYRGEYSQVSMTNAVSRAKTQARKEGRGVADGEIIGRFRSVVDTNQAPDAEYVYPSHTFRGYDNGYVTDQRGGSFDEVYNLNWVSRNDKSLRRIEARAVYGMYNGTYNAAKLCKPVNVLFAADNTRLTLWDYFKARSEFRFQNYGWKNVDRSLKHFLNNVSGRLERIYYDSKIQGSTERVSVVIQTARAEVSYRPAVAAVTEPILDAAGLPTGEVRVITPAVAERAFVPSRPEIREMQDRPVSGRGKDYYRNIYKDAFKLSYDKYYRTKFFSVAFIKNISIFGGVGELAGSAVGKKVADDQARMISYDNKYREDSIGAFNIEWKVNYDQQWASIWSHFDTNAMVEVNEVTINGDKKTADGIFTSGEKVGAQLRLTNIGRGQNKKVYYRLYGDVQGNQKEYSVNAPTSARFNVGNDSMGNIKTGVPREQIQVGVQIRGAVEFDSSLTNRKSKRHQINAYAEIKGSPSATLNAISGAGSVRVELTNPANANFDTGKLVSVTADLGKFGVKQSETFTLPGQSSRVTTLSFSGLDPLKVIQNGGISGTISANLGGADTESKQVRQAIGMTRNQAYATYYNELVSDREVNSGSADRAGRTTQMVSIIHSITEDEKGTNWKDTYQANKSAVGQLAAAYTSSKAAGTLSEGAKSRYNELGLALDQIEVSATKRKAYRAVLNKFAPSVEVKKKNK